MSYGHPNLDAAKSSDEFNIVDKATLEKSGLKNEHIEIIDSYLLLFQNIVNPIYDQTEQMIGEFYAQVKTKLWFKLPLLLSLLALLLSYIKSLLGFSSVSKPTLIYNREEPISHADIKQHFVNFGKEINNFKQKVDGIPKNGSTNINESKSQGISQGNTDEVRKKIQNITQSINKNEEALDKFHKEKKNIDSFLLDFKKEVIASQTAIWKELHNVKNILSGKPGNVNPVTPKQKEKTQERSTTSSNLNLSNEIERNSPETTRPTESLIRPESYRGKEENDSAVKYEQPIPQNHAKTKTIDDSSGVEPMLSNRNQNASQSFQNKLTENQNKLLEIQNQIETNNALLASNISNQNPVPESNKTEAKIERFNTDEAQSEPIEEKKEVSPFRVPPIGGGVRPPFKPNMNTKMPMPNIRKPGPIVGGNPFNKPVATKPNAQGEGA